MAALLVGLDELTVAGTVPHDVGRTPAEICEHLAARHHAWLHEELAWIAAGLGDLARRYGERFAELQPLRAQFHLLAGELLDHLAREQLLMAACRATDGAPPLTPDPSELEDHERAHRAVVEHLRAIRGLTGDYELERAICVEHRALLAALRNLEVDLHRQIHEENNILFPLLRATVR